MKHEYGQIKIYLDQIRLFWHANYIKFYANAFAYNESFIWVITMSHYSWVMKLTYATLHSVLKIIFLFEIFSKTWKINLPYSRIFFLVFFFKSLPSGELSYLSVDRPRVTKNFFISNESSVNDSKNFGDCPKIAWGRTFRQEWVIEHWYLENRYLGALGIFGLSYHLLSLITAG